MEFIETRGLLYIYYGTMTGTSCKFAYNLYQEAKEKYLFVPYVINLSDFDPDEFLRLKLIPIVFILSTYGSGGPTEDAEKFFDWLKSLKNKNEL